METKYIINLHDNATRHASNRYNLFSAHAAGSYFLKKMQETHPELKICDARPMMKPSSMAYHISDYDVKENDVIIVDQVLPFEMMANAYDWSSRYVTRFCTMHDTLKENRWIAGMNFNAVYRYLRDTAYDDAIIETVEKQTLPWYCAMLNKESPILDKDIKIKYVNIMIDLGYNEEVDNSWGTVIDQDYDLAKRTRNIDRGVYAMTSRLLHIRDKMTDALKQKLIDMFITSIVDLGKWHQDGDDGYYEPQMKEDILDDFDSIIRDLFRDPK